MRKLTLTKSGFNKLRSSQRELKSADVEDSIKSLPPGEWCLLSAVGSTDTWACFVNPLVDDRYVSINVVTLLKPQEISGFTPENFISIKISEAYKKRLSFSGYEKGCRVFYGASDGLPGLIIDYFKNAAIVQINTAGLDKHRELISNLTSYMLKVKSFLLDNQKYREKEALPSYEVETLPDLQVEENGIFFDLRSDVIQKVGFYYDHRENRNQLVQLLQRLQLKPERALDLFCYAGAWGFNALKGGASHVDFVDQGDFAREIDEGLELNKFAGKGKFFRHDVFKFLDEQISRKVLYDLILCDPPAFAKSLLQKKQALEGYSKLHRKVMKITSPGAVCVFSSCTHYVSHDEFQSNINEAALKENKKIQLLSCGIQGWDHPITTLADRANYIKSYTYLMES